VVRRENLNWAAAGFAPRHPSQSTRYLKYVVNGKTVVIHGMGINTQYRSLLNDSDRRARLDADLEEMQALGVNTLVGWDPAESDDVLLEAAQRHGIGVVMPFDLHPDADYTDPAVRASLTRQRRTSARRGI
jgi:hypothetical protein